MSAFLDRVQTLFEPTVANELDLVYFIDTRHCECVMQHLFHHFVPQNVGIILYVTKAMNLLNGADDGDIRLRTNKDGSKQKDRRIFTIPVTTTGDELPSEVTSLVHNVSLIVGETKVIHVPETSNALFRLFNVL
jgi:hypothetical protein